MSETNTKNYYSYTKTFQKINYGYVELGNSAQIFFLVLTKYTETKISFPSIIINSYTKEEFKLLIFWEIETQTEILAENSEHQAFFLKIEVAGKLNGFILYQYKAEFLIGLHNKDPPTNI